MSWGITAIGSSAAIKAELAKQQTMSPAIKAAIIEVLEDPNYSSDKTSNGFHLQAYGHSGEGSNIGKIEVQRIRILPDPIPAAASPATPAS